jgi:superfamily I DNA and/or RNA helicase
MVEALLAEGQQILLTAYTNRAVDEICKAVAAITPAPPRFIRMGREAACDPAWRPYLADRALADCRTRDDVRRRLAHCPIIVGTVSTLASRADLFRLKHFDVAIVDEATQILEPQLLPLLCRRDATGRHDAIDRFILIGDHKQLPAVVQQTPDDSRIADPALRALGLTNLRHSLFERLYRSHADPRAVDRLHRQGRMNQEVADFPNRAFYGGHLSIVGLPHQQGALTLAPALAADPFADLLTRRVAFLPAAPQAAATPSGTGFIKYNHGEAGIAADLAAAIYRQYAATTGFTPATLGIITPYRSQIALIRRALAAQGIPALREVTVDTVERFQGSERDVIIYSFCVNSAAQLALLANLTEADWQVIDRKLNVVLTRARCQIFLVGAPELLRLNPIYARLLDHSTAR